MNASPDAAWSQAEARKQARIDLAACYRLAAHFGFNEGIDNHLTMLVPGCNDRFYLAPFGLHWSEVKASDFLVLDFNGRMVSGRGLVEDTALYIHLPVHRLSPQARCVLHTHMPYATRALHAGESASGNGGAEAAGLLRRHRLRRTTTAWPRRDRGRAPGARARRQVGADDGQSRGAGGGATAAQAFERLYFLERAARRRCWRCRPGGRCS